MDTIERIKQQISQNDVILYMKGTPLFPQCGFSGQVVHILRECGITYHYINVLENPDIRQELPKYADWPTFPQLHVKGELIGGCDIITESFQNGELLDIFKQAGITTENKQATIEEALP